MPYTARELITDAYYISGIVSPDFQTVSGAQITRGLRALNGLLAEEGITGRTIPYFKEYEWTAVAGQEKYFIEYLIQVSTLTFNIGEVRYCMRSEHRDRYFGSPRGGR